MGEGRAGQEDLDILVNEIGPLVTLIIRVRENQDRELVMGEDPTGLLHQHPHPLVMMGRTSHQMMSPP